MDKEIIITIRYRDTYEEDFEVPVDSSIWRWIKPIETHLRQIKSMGNMDTSELSLYYNGELLDSQSKLQELGIWDGAIFEAAWN